MRASHTIPKDTKGSYAVIFSYQLSNDLEGYVYMDQKTIDAVVDIPGYLGYDKFGDGNENIFISYWEDLESIDIWRKNFLHIEAKKYGKQWYKKMRVQTVQIHDDINFWS
tara:strand:+ start:996 stop:1325 length:330 start_codon:yes stop_codon:yes gene_type:complete